MKMMSKNCKNCGQENIDKWECNTGIRFKPVEGYGTIGFVIEMLGDFDFIRKIKIYDNVHAPLEIEKPFPFEIEFLSISLWLLSHSIHPETDIFWVITGEVLEIHIQKTEGEHE
jgi:hypothetical protein